MFSTLNWLYDYCQGENFHNGQIVFPLGKPEVEKFLALLKDAENEKTVGIPNIRSEITEVPSEKTAIFANGSTKCMLYRDTFRNNGKHLYLIIYLDDGTLHSSGVLGVYSLDGSKLRSEKFDETVIQNLFPGKDMSSFYMYLARPFAVRENGQIVMRFLDNPKSTKPIPFKWVGNSFVNVASP